MPILVKPIARFSREYKQLRKKYPRLQETLQHFVSQLEAGEKLGERLQEMDDAHVYKVRLANKDANKGKSGGFRVIYYVWTEEGIFLLSIYSKNEQENISTDDIRRMIQNADTLNEND